MRYRYMNTSSIPVSLSLPLCQNLMRHQRQLRLCTVISNSLQFNISTSLNGSKFPNGRDHSVSGACSAVISRKPANVLPQCRRLSSNKRCTNLIAILGGHFNARLDVLLHVGQVRSRGRNDDIHVRHYRTLVEKSDDTVDRLLRSVKLTISSWK